MHGHPHPHTQRDPRYFGRNKGKKLPNKSLQGGKISQLLILPPPFFFKNSSRLVSNPRQQETFFFHFAIIHLERRKLPPPRGFSFGGGFCLQFPRVQTPPTNNSGDCSTRSGWGELETSRTSPFPALKRAPLQAGAQVVNSCSSSPGSSASLPPALH